jgi:hypothetical protein
LSDIACRVWWRSTPTTQSKKLPALGWGDLEQLNWQQAIWHKRKWRERSWEFCFVKYYYYSIILCLYTHWRENVVMSKEVISSASKLLICSITTPGYGCHMVGHSS